MFWSVLKLSSCAKESQWDDKSEMERKTLHRTVVLNLPSTHTKNWKQFSIQNEDYLLIFFKWEYNWNFGTIQRFFVSNVVKSMTFINVPKRLTSTRLIGLSIYQPLLMVDKKITTKNLYLGVANIGSNPFPGSPDHGVILISKPPAANRLEIRRSQPRQSDGHGRPYQNFIS